MTIEQVPDIPMFRQNTAAFIHELPPGCLSNVDGESNYVRIQVLTNAGALDRAKQLAVVEQLTSIAAGAAGDPSLTSRTWVLLTEAPDGGWGLSGHANTNEELVLAARAHFHACEASPSSASGASVTWGEMCQADRAQLDAISGRTSCSGTSAVAAAPASATWRSQAWVRDDRRLRSSDVRIIEDSSRRMPRPVPAHDAYATSIRPP